MIDVVVPREALDVEVVVVADVFVDPRRRALPVEGLVASRPGRWSRGGLLHADYGYPVVGLVENGLVNLHAQLAWQGDAHCVVL